MTNDKLYNWGAPILLQPDAIFRTDSWWVNWPGGNPILLPCGVSPGLRPSVFSPAELYACSASHQARIPLAASIASSHLYCYAAQLQSVQSLFKIKSDLSQAPVLGSHHSLKTSARHPSSALSVQQDLGQAPVLGSIVYTGIRPAPISSTVSYWEVSLSSSRIKYLSTLASLAASLMVVWVSPRTVLVRIIIIIYVSILKSNYLSESLNHQVRNCIQSLRQ